MAEAKEREDILEDALKFKSMSVDDLTSLARLAELAESFEDMVVFMRAVVEKRLKAADGTDDVLTKDQRNLFSVAYKNVVGARRSSWRTLTAFYQDGDLDAKELTDEVKKASTIYQMKVAGEIKTTCLQISGLLEKLAAAEKKKEEATEKDTTKKKKKEDDNWIFYKKMMGDYYRYLGEAFKEEEEYKDKMKENYKAAMDKAQTDLEPTSPTRLGLALNFSVCYFEILNQPKEACDLAKKAFDHAIEKLDSLNDTSYKDSTLIMQLLRDNLTIWASDNDKEDAEQ